jgi:hypothetical protein
MQGRFFVVALTVIVTVIACNGSRDVPGTGGSELLIVGGEATGANEYPSVVRLTVQEATPTSPEQICTGVIISHRTVLAASHCIKKLTTTSPNGSYHFIAVEAGATRTKTAINSAFAVTYKEPLGVKNIPENHVALDLAVLDFGANAFQLSSYPKIATRPPQVGENLTLVGFGATSFKEGEGTTGNLNKGQNTLKFYDQEDGYIMLSSRLDAQGIPEGALAAPGDSGGPLFDSQGNLMGIGSALNLQTSVATNFFVDLTSYESKTLLGRYLQEFGGPSPGEFLTGFHASMGDSYASIKPRTQEPSDVYLAMCGGKKGKGKGKGNGKPSDDIPSKNGDDDDDDDGGEIVINGVRAKNLETNLNKNPNGSPTGSGSNGTNKGLGNGPPLVVVTQG